VTVGDGLGVGVAVVVVVVGAVTVGEGEAVAVAVAVGAEVRVGSAVTVTDGAAVVVPALVGAAVWVGLAVTVGAGREVLGGFVGLVVGLPLDSASHLWACRADAQEAAECFVGATPDVAAATAPVTIRETDARVTKAARPLSITGSRRSRRGGVSTTLGPGGVR
jgi:hypothetical protein